MFYDICLNNFISVKGSYEKYNTALTKYSEKEINNFKGGKVNISSKKRDILDFIENSLKHTSNNKLYFGKVNSDLAFRIYKDTHLYLKNYNFSLQNHALKHIMHHHGSRIKEKVRGQEEILKEDFLLLTEILTKYDLISLSHKVESNNISIDIRKNIGNITYVLVCYISNKRHNIEIKTLYKIRKKFFSSYTI